MALAVASGLARSYLLTGIFIASIFAFRVVSWNYWKSESELHRVELGRQGLVKVTVMQNGPFKTVPYGAGLYKVGEVISLEAIQKDPHPFRNWVANTELIEISNPYSSRTTASAKGNGVITANFD
ncbi:MAG: hypothetical protein HY247_06125 [archaeon]|nr:MAG: hypothetical protein HY247_06125 [archaeon]